MRKSLGFTLAEVLITLAIIGVVAAMTIPSVIINTNQQEYKTGLKKAVSVLNQAITMNMALENSSPSDTTTQSETTQTAGSLMAFLASRLNVIKETKTLDFGGGNAAFYTADGMRFEFPQSAGNAAVNGGTDYDIKACGDGVTKAEDGTTVLKPCLILVDVNGDRKPNPSTPTAGDYEVPKANGTRINDVFTIIITDTAAIPFGTVAQRTMFQAD